MGVGRFVCVALPFGLTLGSLICILISMLAGVTDKNLELFNVKTQNFSISSSSLANLADLLKRDPDPRTPGTSPNGGLTVAALTGSSSSSSNITASELGLADSYRVSLWNYCSVTSGKTNCTSAKYNWAKSSLNTTAIEALATSTSGVTVTLPTDLKGSFKTFIAISKWTQIVYIIAFLTCAVELFFGVFAICSRAGSCLTFFVSGISTTTIIAASVLATVQSSVVTGAIKASSKAYGVNASINTSFLATTWIACAFSIGAGLFWMFTICCCAADHHSKNKAAASGLFNKGRRGDDNEKLIPTGIYQRVNDPAEYHSGYTGQQQGIYNGQQEFGAPVHNVKPTTRQGAYEPYTHGAV